LEGGEAAEVINNTQVGEGNSLQQRNWGQPEQGWGPSHDQSWGQPQPGWVEPNQWNQPPQQFGGQPGGFGGGFEDQAMLTDWFQQR